MSLPVIHYEFNTTSFGTDSSGSGFDSVASTTISLVTDPERGPVASFNGTNSKLTGNFLMPTSLSRSNPRTYMFWMKYTKTGEYMVIHSHGEPTSGETWRAFIDGAVEGFHISTFGPFSTPVTLAENTWVHIANTYDGTNVNIFINGVYSVSSAISIDTKLSRQLGIAYDIIDDSRYFNGLLSDFRIYDVALSESEILAASQGPVAYPTLLIQPRSINIPVEIREVTGATGYQITYEGPTGGEIIAFAGSTDLMYNIIGVEPGTQYTIKLYVDNGSGNVFTEEVTTTTLPNVATNYDVNIFVKDGVINLSSLPDATISNVAEVMNELFTTGDVVSVSLQGKPELNTSFINLGDELSIDAIDGVLLPFVEASTPGQDVSVRLSDGSTIVDINFDETVNTITVNDVTYSPGDSFILDGKKVTVVEYS